MPSNNDKWRQQAKHYGVYLLMVGLFVASMYLIFAPRADRTEAEQGTGFNTDIPEPKEADIVGSKKTAYELEQARQQQMQKMQTLEEYAFALGHEEAPATTTPQMSHIDQSARTQPSGTLRRRSSFDASQSAYRDIHSTLGSFYESPAQENEAEHLREQIETLKASLAQQQTEQPTYEEQLALMEKSYQLAAKYMPQKSSPQSADQARDKNRKAKVTPVGMVTRTEVSSLPQPRTDSATIARLSQPRNHVFHTAVGSETPAAKNTIRACIHDDQTLTDGQSIRLRLLEPMRAGGVVLPRNTLITGNGTLQGERLAITISVLEFEGTILPVEITVYDNDGQSGIYIPGSMEVNAVKEVAANLGQNLGTTVSISNQSAGDQLLAEIGKGAIDGVSQYVTKKMRTVKVHLKAGYQVFLYQPED